MKIIGIYNKTGGSYHRIKLPLSFIKEDIIFLETLTEDNVKDVDIICIHWSSPVSIPKLSIWKETYGFKIVADIDDTWELQKQYKNSIFHSKHLCTIADAVICTNEYIKNQVLEVNSNIHIIPNYLPNEGQFKFNNNSFNNDKVSIGIGGSISHYKDWLLLEKHIKKILKDKDLASKIQWCIFGINSDPLWKNIISMMPKGTIRHMNMTVEDYMLLYENINILLCPLADNSLSEGRSALKIYECAHTGVIPIISDLYIKKDNLFKILPTNDWYNNIRDLVLNKQSRTDALNNLKKIRNSYNYENDCVLPRLLLFSDLLNKNIYTEKNQKHELYSIKYLDSQQIEHTPYINKIKTIEERSYLFEYNPIINIVENSTTEDYIGIFSHRFPFKTGFYKNMVLNILDKEESDIVNFCRPIENYLEFTEKHHPGFMNIFTIICDELNLKIRPKKITSIYSNFFAAKGKVYREYVELLKKAIDIMENNKEIKKLCWQDANYNSLTKAQLFEYTELPHYTFHTFILERLLSVWLDNNNFSISTYY